MWLEGRTLLRLLDNFFSTATAAAAAADPKTAAGSAAAAAGGSAAVDLSVVDAVSAACEVAVLLSSYLQAFLDTACPSKLQLPSQQQQQPGVLGPSCCVLLVENLVGPHGSVTHMNRVQQQACLNPGRRAATK